MARNHGEKLFFNGIDGETGRYLVDPISWSDVAAAALGEPRRPARARWLERLTSFVKGVRLALPDAADPGNLADTGWAVVFHTDESEAVKQALEPLVEHRRAMAGTDRVRVLDVRPGEAWRSWLNRHGVELGRMDPEKLPYYVLLVGGPETIPFDFQHTLAVEYAVGRLGFDRPDEYRRYADSLIACETAAQPLVDRAVTCFAPRHDKPTRMSADLLVRELMERLGSVSGLEVRGLLENDATRGNLSRLLRAQGDARPPGVLFTASHGMGFKTAGHPRQEAWQGALICQDWGGGRPVVPDEHCFGAEHLDDDARVHGLVGFFFACYGAGTPRDDQFPLKAGPPPRLAERPFLSALPQRFLTHPRGGALAMIGHVDRAWSFSFHSPEVGPQVRPFENALVRLLEGVPVGHAVRDFREIYAVLSTQVSQLTKGTAWGLEVPEGDRDELARAWIERNDAQGYVVLGDPAARLRLDAASR